MHVLEISTKRAACFLRYKRLNICTVKSNFVMWASAYKCTILYETMKGETWSAKQLVHTHSTSLESVVLTGVSTLASGELTLIKPGAQINGACYRDVRIFCQPSVKWLEFIHISAVQCCGWWSVQHGSICLNIHLHSCHHSYGHPTAWTIIWLTMKSGACYRYEYISVRRTTDTSLSYQDQQCQPS